MADKPQPDAAPASPGAVPQTEPKTEADISLGIQQLLDRFGFPPGDYKSTRIERDHLLYTTRYYKLNPNVKISDVADSEYDKAVDETGGAADKELQDYFKYKLEMFPEKLDKYSLVNPPPLFDSVFEHSIKHRFKRDEDIRSVANDFKDVCVGNFFQKLQGKRYLQRIASEAHSWQGYAVAWVLAFAAGLAQLVVGLALLAFSLLGATPATWWDRTIFTLTAISGVLLLSGAIRARHWFTTNAAITQLSELQIKLDKWTEWDMIMLCLKPALIVAASLLLVLGLPLIPWPQEFALSAAATAVAIFFAVLLAYLLRSAILFLAKRFMDWVEERVSKPLDQANEILHQKYETAVDNAAGSFVAYVQTRLPQLDRVFNILDKRIDQEEELAQIEWGSRAKKWTMLKILVAKRVEYIEKDMQAKLWKIRMAHWAYNRLGTFLATVYVPYLSMVLTLNASSRTWWALILALWPAIFCVSPLALLAAAAAPALGRGILYVLGAFSVGRYELDFFRMITRPFNVAISSAAEQMQTENLAAESVKVPNTLAPRAITRHFFLGGAIVSGVLTVGLIAIWHLSAGQLWSLDALQDLGAALLVYGLLQIIGYGVFLMAAHISAGVQSVAAKSNSKWNTEIGFLERRIKPDTFMLAAARNMPEVLGMQVERDKNRIWQMKTQYKPSTNR